MTAPPSNLNRLYYNSFAAKSHSTTTQYRQVRRLQKLKQLKLINNQNVDTILGNWANYVRPLTAE